MAEKKEKSNALRKDKKSERLKHSRRKRQISARKQEKETQHLKEAFEFNLLFHKVLRGFALKKGKTQNQLKVNEEFVKLYLLFCGNSSKPVLGKTEFFGFIKALLKRVGQAKYIPKDQVLERFYEKFEKTNLSHFDLLSFCSLESSQLEELSSTLKQKLQSIVEMDGSPKTTFYLYAKRKSKKIFFIDPPSFLSILDQIGISEELTLNECFDGIFRYLNPLGTPHVDLSQFKLFLREPLSSVFEHTKPFSRNIFSNQPLVVVDIFDNGSAQNNAEGLVCKGYEHAGEGIWFLRKTELNYDSQQSFDRARITDIVVRDKNDSNLLLSKKGFVKVASSKPVAKLETFGRFFKNRKDRIWIRRNPLSLTSITNICINKARKIDILKVSTPPCRGFEAAGSFAKSTILWVRKLCHGKAARLATLESEILHNQKALEKRLKAKGKEALAKEAATIELKLEQEIQQRFYAAEKTKSYHKHKNIKNIISNDSNSLSGFVSREKAAKLFKELELSLPEKDLETLLLYVEDKNESIKLSKLLRLLRFDPVNVSSTIQSICEKNPAGVKKLLKEKLYECSLRLFESLLAELTNTFTEFLLPSDLEKLIIAFTDFSRDDIIRFDKFCQCLQARIKTIEFENSKDIQKNERKKIQLGFNMQLAYDNLKKLIDSNYCGDAEEAFEILFGTKRQEVSVSSFVRRLKSLKATHHLDVHEILKLVSFHKLNSSKEKQISKMKFIEAFSVSKPENMFQAGEKSMEPEQKSELKNGPEDIVANKTNSLPISSIGWEKIKTQLCRRLPHITQLGRTPVTVEEFEDKILKDLLLTRQEVDSLFGLISTKKNYINLNLLKELLNMDNRSSDILLEERLRFQILFSLEQGLSLSRIFCDVFNVAEGESIEAEQFLNGLKRLYGGNKIDVEIAEKVFYSNASLGRMNLKQFELFYNNESAASLLSMNGCKKFKFVKAINRILSLIMLEKGKGDLIREKLERSDDNFEGDISRKLFRSIIKETVPLIEDEHLDTLVWYYSNYSGKIKYRYFLSRVCHNENEIASWMASIRQVALLQKRKSKEYHCIWSHFKKYDDSNSGHVPRTVFRKVLYDDFGLVSILKPYQLLAVMDHFASDDILLECDNDSFDEDRLFDVNYIRFCRGLRPPEDEMYHVKRKILKRLTEVEFIQGGKLKFRTYFEKYDEHDTGFVSLSDFVEVLSQSLSQLITYNEQNYIISYFANRNGWDIIDYLSFCRFMESDVDNHGLYKLSCMANELKNLLLDSPQFLHSEKGFTEWISIPEMIEKCQELSMSSTSNTQFEALLSLLLEPSEHRKDMIHYPVFLERLVRACGPGGILFPVNEKSQLKAKLDHYLQSRHTTDENIQCYNNIKHSLQSYCRETSSTRE